MNNMKSTGEGNPPTHRGFQVGQRVISTSPHGTAGAAGTVVSVKYAEPFNGGGTTGRLIVTVDMDESRQRLGFIADGTAPIDLVHAAPPIVCAPWCVDGSGHSDVRLPGDQTCVSEEKFVRPEVQARGAWKDFVTFTIHARRQNAEAQPEVVLWEQEQTGSRS